MIIIYHKLVIINHKTLPTFSDIFVTLPLSETYEKLVLVIRTKNS